MRAGLIYTSECTCCWGLGPGLPVLTQLPIKELHFRSIGPYRLHQQCGFGGCLSYRGCSLAGSESNVQGVTLESGQRCVLPPVVG